MNFLRRAIAVQPLLSAHYSRKRILVLYPVSLLHHSSLYSTSRTATTYATTKYRYTPIRSKTKPPQQPPSPSPVSDSDVPIDYARPSEIPYQPKVANVVKLIGHVQIPVQFKATEDGNYWAGTIVQQPSSNPSSLHSVWVPVVFEGDLAHIATCHLKEKDYVYIEGELCVDQPPLPLSQGQANVQVMAHSLNFVEVSSQSMQSSVSQTTDLSSSQGQKLKAPNSSEPISLDHKETCENVHQKKISHQKKTSHPDMMRKKDNSSVGSWRDLLKDPKQWCDYRESKQNGLVKPKHPDFKHKDSGVGLWLVSAPGGVLAGLKGLDFDVSQMKDKRVAGIDDDLWKDLVENFEMWWDNRSKKVNERSPDFKHKESGKALWLSNSPPWVSSSLPPLEAKQTSVPPLKAKQTSVPPLKAKQNDAGDQDGDPWKDLVENPNKWWDNRSKKVSERSPDFKHKETGKALWLSDSPPSVSSILPLLEAKQTSLPPLKAKQNDVGDQDGDPWKDLVENPNKWWDNRSNKLNAKGPDFKHKDTKKVLWLSDAPAWALPRLQPLNVKGTDAGAYQKKQKESDAGGVGGDPWKDLVDNPKKWWDKRSNKVSERAPDFKHKETGQALWLNRAPQWALSSLPRLVGKQSDVKRTRGQVTM